MTFGGQWMIFWKNIKNINLWNFKGQTGASFLQCSFWKTMKVINEGGKYKLEQN